MIKCQFCISGHIVLFTLLSLFIFPSVLVAGSNRKPVENSRHTTVMNDPDLIPIKIRIRITPDKVFYGIDDTVRIEYEIYLDKSDQNYNSKYEYLVVDDDDVTTRTPGWNIIESDLKAVSKINNKHNRIEGSILLKNVHNNTLSYSITIRRLSDEKAGRYLPKYNFYYDHFLTFYLWSKSYNNIDKPILPSHREFQKKIEYIGESGLLEK